MLIFILECSFQDVAEIFDNEPMHTTIMLEWKNLANRLNTPQNIVHKHQLDLNMDKLTHIDVVEELLQDWRLRNGKNATIDALLDIIMASYDWPFITGKHLFANWIFCSGTIKIAKK